MSLMTGSYQSIVAIQEIDEQESAGVLVAVGQWMIFDDEVQKIRRFALNIRLAFMMMSRL